MFALETIRLPEAIVVLTLWRGGIRGAPLSKDGFVNNAHIVHILM